MTEKTCPIPEPFGNRAKTIFFLAGLFFLSFIGRVILSPLMPTIEQDLHISHRQAGSFFLLISIGFFTAQVGSGFLSSRIRHRGSLILSGISIGISLMLFPLTTSPWSIGAVMILLGMAAGLHMPSAIATITAMVRRQDWGKALSIHQAAPSVSLILAPWIAEALSGWISWQGILFGLGVVSLAAALFFIYGAEGGDFPGDDPKPSVLKSVLGLPSFWVMVLLFALIMGATFGIYSMLPLYLTIEHGMDRGFANTILGLSRIPSLLVAFMAGWIVDKIGEKKTMAGVLFFAGAATILMGILPGSWLIIIIFLQPAIASCFFPAAFSALSRITHPNLRSVATSFATPIAFLVGGGLMPTGLGYMGENYSFGLGIILSGCLMLAGPFLLMGLKLREQIEPGC